MKKYSSKAGKDRPLKERVRQLETCFKITSLLNSELNLPSLLDIIMKNAKKVMKADACSLLLLDKETGDLVFQVALSKVADRVKTMPRLKVGEGIAGAVVKTGRSQNIRDVYTHPKFNPNFDKATGFKTGSLLCAPLKVKADIIGACEVIHSRRQRKVFSTDDMALFHLFCDCAAIAIENARMHQVMLENQRHDQEIEFARSTQESFLPGSPPEHGKFLFAGRMHPAKYVGGDYYDFIRFDENKLAIVLGDVSGKGVHAALQMGRLMSDFRHISQKNSDPGDVLFTVNNLLRERTSHGMFSTAVYLVLDMEKRRMRVANAGHPFLLKGDKNNKVTEIGKTGGVPLGILPNTEYPEEEIVLKRGDRVLLFSDGISEPKNNKDEAFGIERLQTLFQNGGTSPEETISEIEKTLRRFVGSAPQFDDQTCVIFQTL